MVDGGLGFDLSKAADAARDAEAVGYDGVWTAETSHDPFLPLLLGAGATEHIELGRCPRPRRLPIPKLIDLADGRAVYDESFWRKQPDWTYTPDIGADDGTEHRS